jgi:hypothetical protein
LLYQKLRLLKEFNNNEWFSTKSQIKTIFSQCMLSTPRHERDSNSQLKW